MSNEHQLKRLYIELISGANFLVKFVTKQVPLNWLLSRILHKDRSFVIRRRNHKQDTNLSHETEVDQTLCHAVTLWTTL
jgi:hypothetical protein